MSSGCLVNCNYVLENAFHMYVIAFNLHISNSPSQFTGKKTEAWGSKKCACLVLYFLSYTPIVFPKSYISPFLKFPSPRTRPTSLLPKPRTQEASWKPSVSQETDLYSTKFYTSGISRHLGANPQHSTVTNGQTLEPAGGRG